MALKAKVAESKIVNTVCAGGNNISIRFKLDDLMDVEHTTLIAICHVTILAAWFFLVLPLFPCPFVSCMCFPVCLVCQGVGRCGLPPPPPLGGHCWRS